MLRPDDRRHAVVDIIVGQDRAQKLLFGLDGMGHALSRLNRQLIAVDAGNLVHRPCAPLLHYPGLSHNRGVRHRANCISCG